MKQLKNKMDVFEELKRYKLKNDKLQGKLDKSMSETRMMSAENSLKSDKSSAEFTALKMELNNLKKELKDKEKQYKQDIESIRIEKKNEIDKYIRNSSEIVEKNTSESTK